MWFVSGLDLRLISFPLNDFSPISFSQNANGFPLDAHNQIVKLSLKLCQYLHLYKN